MAKRILSFLILVAIFFVLPASAPVSLKTDVATANNEVVSNVEDGVIKARFENMLNHNYVYDTDFESDLLIIENSILALLDKAEDGQIDKGLVLGFIAGMYGRQVDPAAAEYDFAPADDGKFVVLPRGYDDYEHNITSIEVIDGGYKVVSNVTVYPCDGFEYLASSETIFVENEGSAFGYNIVSSTLLEPDDAYTV